MPTCDSLAKLDELSKFVRKHFIALKKLDAAHEVEGFKMNILGRLCDTVADKVCSNIRKSNGQPVVPAILAALKEEIGVLELQEIAKSLNRPREEPEDMAKLDEVTFIHNYINNKLPPTFNNNFTFTV